MATRTILIIVLTIYLVGLGFLIPAVNNAIVKESAKNIIHTTNSTSSILTGNSEHFNLITSIVELPLWFNTIFIIIPFAILLILIALAVIPTINAGA